MINYVIFHTRNQKVQFKFDDVEKKTIIDSFVCFHRSMFLIFKQLGYLIHMQRGKSYS